MKPLCSIKQSTKMWSEGSLCSDSSAPMTATPATQLVTLPNSCLESTLPVNTATGHVALSAAPLQFKCASQSSDPFPGPRLHSCTISLSAHREVGIQCNPLGCCTATQRLCRHPSLFDHSEFGTCAPGHPCRSARFAGILLAIAGCEL